MNLICIVLDLKARIKKEDRDEKQNIDHQTIEAEHHSRLGAVYLGDRGSQDARLDEGWARAKKAGSTSSFPSGPPPQYSSCLKLFNFGVRMGSGAFGLVWPTAKTYLSKLLI